MDEQSKAAGSGGGPPRQRGPAIASDTGVLVLDPADALDRGRTRMVFQHPTEPGRLIKVMRPGYAQQAQEKRWPFSKSRRFGVYKVHAREIAHFLECQGRAPETQRLFPVIYGFERTSLGLGLVCEKIVGDDGGLAPTLTQVIRSGRAGERERAALERLAEDLERHHFVCSDFTPANIVVAEGGRLVIIDGLGETHFIPLRRLLRRVNRRYQQRRLAQMRAALATGSMAPVERRRRRHRS